jgi:hypothetical protein
MGLFEQLMDISRGNILQEHHDNEKKEIDENTHRRRVWGDFRKLPAQFCIGDHDA